MLHLSRLVLISVLAFLAALWGAEWNSSASSTVPASAVLSERNYGAWGYTVARSATDRIEVRFVLNGATGTHTYYEELPEFAAFLFKKADTIDAYVRFRRPLTEADLPLVLQSARDRVKSPTLVSGERNVLWTGAEMTVTAVEYERLRHDPLVAVVDVGPAFALYEAGFGTHSSSDISFFYPLVLLSRDDLLALNENMSLP